MVRPHPELADVASSSDGGCLHCNSSVTIHILSDGWHCLGHAGEMCEGFATNAEYSAESHYCYDETGYLTGPVIVIDSGLTVGGRPVIAIGDGESSTGNVE